MRPCLDCPTLTYGARCADHARECERERTRAKRARRPYLTQERARRAAAVAAWRTEYGDWCPGWRRPPHTAWDLTADHAHAVAAGGPELGPLSVLCRSCNGRKGDAV